MLDVQRGHGRGIVKGVSQGNRTEVGDAGAVQDDLLDRELLGALGTVCVGEGHAEILQRAGSDHHVVIRIDGEVARQGDIGIQRALGKIQSVNDGRFTTIYLEEDTTGGVAGARIERHLLHLGNNASGKAEFQDGREIFEMKLRIVLGRRRSIGNIGFFGH